jgi:RNA polymerase sigma-70 factor (ECF subfamily)
MSFRDESKTSVTLIDRVAVVPADDVAWHQFVERYGPKILRWCFSRGLQDADAEDVCQSVLTTLAVRLRRFEYDPSRSFRGFLRKVANDALSDAFSARARFVAGGASDTLEQLASLESRDDFLRRLEEEFDHELLEAATAIVRQRVAPQTWEAYRLTTDEGLSGVEAAARVGISVGAVFQGKSRIMSMLKNEVSRLERNVGAASPVE